MDFLTSNQPIFLTYLKNINIQKFSASPSGSTSSEGFGALFDNNSDIYGCAVGEGQGPDFYELVLKNDKVGFATWYRAYHQYVFKLTKSYGKWKIKAGIWPQQKPEATNFITSTQIQNKTGNWS